MGKHHLVLGSMQDVISGSIIEDNHDNRYRQKIARILLKKGYERNQIQARIPVVLKCDNKKALIHLDFLIQNQSKHTCFLIRYGPGSIVTRRTPSRAAAMLTGSPLLIVTNGEDAELIETRSGQILAQGLEAIPFPEELPEPGTTIPVLSAETRERCHRILYAFEINDACPCDENICYLDNGDYP
ncbi:type I restriction enzyme HsdR N-terminal domain-containing protein [Desulfobotulus sp. H1]|uniref:Type I restriction enzyme HsdR N-terminal domain-containing protein n=1 Tax=Desulfobotulus pelophilus TaxID=2823377 RepID=A0ABT3NCG6_9BACT|nr:type I restriction enzyme HsdR N-terminal domain-containing protein [Desulfobotulus pelophilus]MCW7755170.1 type I restriction enzyme HsdR N-terminal domain-containing protein [Desulfobotulus pelophilus]